MDVLKLKPIAKRGSSKKGDLKTTYGDIVAKVFEPNVTHLDDPIKVRASWGFEDNKGRKAFIWCYEFFGKKEKCTAWSVDGDRTLLSELFGEKVSFR